MMVDRYIFDRVLGRLSDRNGDYVPYEDYEKLEFQLKNIADDYGRIMAERGSLKAALEEIKKHMEIASPTGYRLSGVWNIAAKALKDAAAPSDSQKAE